MINKFLYKTKNVLRESYKVLIFCLLFYLVFTFPLPFYVFTDGGITDISQKFVIENGYKQEGSYNLSYVNQLNGNVYTYLLSCIIPGYERVNIDNYQITEDESAEDIGVRDKLMLDNANENAILVAYTKAGKEVKVSDLKLHVAATFDFLESDEKIKIGDIITHFEGVEVDSYEVLKEKIQAHDFGDIVELTFSRDGDSFNTKVKINDYEGSKIMGLSFLSSYNLDVTPKITFKFSNSESGPSAGFMMALAIYDSLIEEDLTHGYKIVGTGSIDADGTVGEIGGIEYKLGGAVRGDADIFLVPSGVNYEEAMKVKKEKNYDIEIVSISNFDEAIDYLNGLKLKKNN